VEEKPGKKRAKTWLPTYHLTDTAVFLDFLVVIGNSTLKEHSIMREAQLRSGPLMNVVAYRTLITTIALIVLFLSLNVNAFVIPRNNILIESITCGYALFWVLKRIKIFSDLF
jgi:hypothetical protein